jgi:ribosomal protein S12 methylthiotransferase
MEKQAGISAAKLKRQIGKKRDVIIDDIVADDVGTQIVARTTSDAPDIDGLVYVDVPENHHYKVGDITQVTITDTDAYDMWAKLAE